MRFWVDLTEAAGLGHRRNEMLQLLLLAATAIGLATWSFTGVPGLGIALGVLACGLGLELLRILATRRQRALDQSWPAVFDLMRSGTQAGLSVDEQFAYLSDSGPLPLRPSFARLAGDVERGASLQQALERFQVRVGSRSADYLALVLSLASELGGRGLADLWDRAASEIRSEQQLVGEIVARQSWVLGSAKMALVAPWLVALMLLGPAGNREAFASPSGTAVLLVGLILSGSAYFLTNWLGRLKLPGRIFYVA